MVETVVSPRSCLGKLRRGVALEIWNGVGHVRRRPGRMKVGLEVICTQNYVVPCFLKGPRRSHWIC